MSAKNVSRDETGREHVRSALAVAGRGLPIVLEPVDAGIDPAAWCAANRAWLDELLADHGAVLLRNFPLPSPADFSRTARAVWGDLFSDYGDLPRNSAGENIYESTPYPANQMILFHNESSHLANWPMRISFHCVTPAAKGGCTPLLDTRALMNQIESGVMANFRERGLLYVRNFSEGIEPTWQRFFHTDDRATVEKMCRDAGSAYEWRPNGSLRVSRRAQAVSRHPVTGDDVFFNQIQHHHIACVDEETRDGLRALFDDDDLPRHVYYGDGSPIPDDVMAYLGELYESVAVRVPWQRGDMLVLDNMLTAHARDPFEGPRHIVVAMGRMSG
ncbi:MAG: TauD/TfdA family dioxygenase [Candidatus Eremiobacteraeota bacterium]|nr:TauD/TfdA family dioxygenase [Candidatus Eremiobacteraeota bacterium]MBC5801699.1 TauD/TfdA family dioxygenase [Candidatus Eremiobacteraeota bacterium]MBC5821263.1 TauD/TfdA family dioxygenase [Candidatus Eremiobacteraeota bacterium]